MLWIFHLPQLSILPGIFLSDPAFLDEAYRSADHGAFSMSAPFSFGSTLPSVTVGPVPCKGVFILSGVWRSVVETYSNRFMNSPFACQIDLPNSFPNLPTFFCQCLGVPFEKLL